MEVIEQRIRDILDAYDIPPGYVDSYIDCIFAYSSFEDYEGVTDEAILEDFEDYMDPDISWKAKKQ